MPESLRPHQEHGYRNDMLAHLAGFARGGGAGVVGIGYGFGYRFESFGLGCTLHILSLHLMACPKRV